MLASTVLADGQTYSPCTRSKMQMGISVATAAAVSLVTEVKLEDAVAMAAQRAARMMDDLMVFVEEWMLAVEKWNGLGRGVVGRLDWSVCYFM